MWAALTFAAIQMPSIWFALYIALPTLDAARQHGFCDNKKTQLVISLLFLFTPFPIVVIAHHVSSLFIVNPQIENFGALLLTAEGTVEAASQIILQIYIILSDSEKEVSVIQIMCIVSSVFTISRTVIDGFLRESFDSLQTYQTFLKNEKVNDDSMLKDRSLFQKLKLMVQFSPAFLTSFVFKVHILPSWAVLFFHLRFDRECCHFYCCLLLFLQNL